MEECTRCEREYDVDAISKIDWYDIDWCENCNKEPTPTLLELWRGGSRKL